MPGAPGLQLFAKALRIPVAVTWKNQDIFDNGSPLYAGHLGFGNPPQHRQVLAKSDLIIAVGTRWATLPVSTTAFQRRRSPSRSSSTSIPMARPSKIFRTDFGLIADPAAVLSDLAVHSRVVSSARESWRSSINEFVREFQRFTSPEPNDAVDFGKVVVSLAAQAPENAVITTDAGNMSTWVHRHWVMTPKKRLLGAIAGAMGFGVPTGVAAAIVDPTRMAITFVGDGGMLMTGQELATAIQYGAKPKIVISDNGIYGTIRTHQEKHFPHRVSGTNLVNPDFTLWAKSFGVFTATITLGDDIDAKVKEFLAHDGAAVLHVKSSKEALSAFTTLSALN